MTSNGIPPNGLNRILTAVETIEVSLGVLSRKQHLDREAYKSDVEAQDVVERRFVKMTEAAIDVGTVLVKHERGTPPSSNPSAMRLLGGAGVLSHTYGDVIDHDIVFNALMDLSRYQRFVHEVRDHLDEIGALD